MIRSPASNQSRPPSQNPTAESDPMTATPSQDPLHGVTLAMMLEQLVADIGWDEMGRQVDIRCFTQDPSIPSSLKFLRKTPWARAKVEALYVSRIVKARRHKPIAKKETPTGDA